MNADTRLMMPDRMDGKDVAAEPHLLPISKASIVPAARNHAP